VPLRDVSEDLERDPESEQSMTATRREFIQLSVVGSAAFVLGFCVDARAEARAHSWKPNAWIRIDEDGATVIIGKQEMGQGVRTSLAMLVAEELDLDWSKIRIEQASTGSDYKNLNTGGSGSVWSGWRTLRTPAATAREMLLLAAAKEWSADRATLRTENGFVIRPDGTKRSYASLAATAATIEVPKNVPLKTSKDFRIVGKRTKKLDAPAIVTGAAKYGLDTRVPGMKFATLVRGDFKTFDATDARKVRGVRDVVAVPGGAAIIADSTWAALKAQPLVRVERIAGTFDSERYIESCLTATSDDHVTRKEGDFAGAMSGAAKKLNAKYVYPFYAHAPVEPMNAIAQVRDDGCEIWAPTQAPNRVQEDVAKHLGIAKEKVLVHPTLIGGGFGRRLGADFAVEAAAVSKAIGGAPVQVVWSRSDDMQFGHLQHATVESMEGGLDAQGNVIAWSHAKISNPIMPIFPPPGTDDPWVWLASGQVDIPYAIPAIRTSYVNASTPVKYGPWRAVESPPSVYGRECFFDELAHAAGRDPLQMRLDLLRAPDKVKAGPRDINRSKMRRVLETVRDRAGWSNRKGQGVACNIYDGETYVAYVVEVSERSGSWHVDRAVCAIDCGLAVNPLGVEQQIEGGIVWAMTQLMAEITIRNGRVQQTSFSDYAVPRLSDMPKVEIHILQDADAHPMGLGEPPVPPFVPAVLNAIFSASGNRIRRLPMSSRA
jgi:isoquinoline 1-oxidoreductase beta subunit